MACVTVEHGAGYIYLKSPGASIWRSVPAHGIYLDLDGNGHLSGIEVLDARSIWRLQRRRGAKDFRATSDPDGRPGILLHLDRVHKVERHTLQQLVSRFGIRCYQEIDLLFSGTKFLGLEIWSVEDYDAKFLLEDEGRLH